VKIIKTFISVVAFFSLNLNLFAQQSELSKAVNKISDFIGHINFNNNNDLQSVDSIYSFALKTNDFDFSATLLSLMFATIPYREVPIRLPLLGININYPLISADESTFNNKNKNLPRYLFFDSPQNDYGDKDKLAHFFGSAFLSYESNIFDLGKLIGYFVEAFEESFKVQSSIDSRDLEVNYYGRMFGETLKTNKQILPSQILLLRSIRYLRITL